MPETRLCKFCSAEFLPVRSDQFFCNANCRLQAHRETDKDETGNLETDIPTIKSDDIATDNETDNPVMLEGTMEEVKEKIEATKKKVQHKYQHKVPDANGIYTGHCGHTSKQPICICSPCVMKGVSHMRLGLDIKACTPPTKGVYHPATNSWHPFVPNRILHANCEKEHRCKVYA